MWSRSGIRLGKMSEYCAGVIDGTLADEVGFKVEQTIRPETHIAKFELPAAP